MFLLILYGTVSILFSFLCSILEAVLLSITPSFISLKQKEGKSYVTALETLKKDVDKPLIAILTLNTIAHTVGAILVGVQAEKTFGNGNNMVMIVSAIMTALILIVSEIIPKTIGATYWKNLANFTTKALNVLIFPLKWTGVLWLLQLTTKLIGKSAHVNTMSREEFMAITDAAEEEGVIKENETTVIRNLLAFKLIKAKDVMTPFTVAVIENEEVSLREFHESHKNLKFSRIPVYKDKSHNITGFILKDDVLEQLVDNKDQIILADIKREIMMVDANQPIPVVFNKLIKNKAHIAIVVDEFGNMIGLISMEDIIETLLGLEIMDESDNIEDMQLLARKNWETRAKRLGIIPVLPKDETNDAVE
ncbi:CNNM domain-containing protein [Aquimarina agarilytica]|uniref:CNNM domain-containing protein n=1 Tax=Aquimarina agarilytica TaxID=1087449 RepID=UPI00028A3BFE|nr:CNNM domain-containing protein [Aquimarina agarilytica]